jgi:NADPH:quinone reductase-like Zn-dependent oxidoreductase
MHDRREARQFESEPTSMGRMKTLCFEQYGPPSALKFLERGIPEPAAGEVLVKVVAAAINPSDVKNVSGHFKSGMPRVPGRDYAGVVVAGAGRAGEEIWGSGPGFGVVRDGAHAEYFVMPAAWISRKPSDLSMEQAAAIETWAFDRAVEAYEAVAGGAPVKQVLQFR